MIERPHVLDESGNVVSKLTFATNSGKAVVAFTNIRGLLLTDQVLINGRKVGWFLVDTERQFVNS